MAIRRHEPWYRRAVILLVTLVVGAGLALAYLSVDRYLHPKEQELVQLRDKEVELNAEIDRLTSLVGTAPNVALMAQAAQQTCTQQLEKMQLEAAKLREDLGFCEKTAKRETGVRRAPIQIPGAGTIPAGSAPN
jgi:cell division protein FtsB